VFEEEEGITQHEVESYTSRTRIRQPTIIYSYLVRDSENRDNIAPRRYN